MISFQPTEEEIEFVDVANRLARERIRPLGHDSESKKQADSRIINEISELGFLALELPEGWGGLELSLLSQVQIMSALSSGDLGIIQGLPGAGDVASFIRLNSLQTTLKANQTELADFKTAAFLDMTRQNEPWGNQLELRSHAHGGYKLHGISSPVRLAEFSDYILVAARDAEDTPVVLWLDDPDDWHVESADVRLGLLASGIGKLSFDQTLVQKEKVLASGQEAEEWIRDARVRINILQAAKEVGLMQAALDYATAYTAERKAFGQEIAAFQGVSFRIADMAMETRIASHLVWKAAEGADKQDTETEGLALSALHRAHRSVRYVTDSAVQMLGGHGFVQEYPAEKWMRDAQAQTILYGREGSLLNERGEQIIGRPKEGVTS